MTPRTVKPMAAGRPCFLIFRTAFSLDCTCSFKLRDEFLALAAIFSCLNHPKKEEKLNEIVGGCKERINVKKYQLDHVFIGQLNSFC